MVMEKRSLFGSAVLRLGACAFIACLAAIVPALRAQEVRAFAYGLSASPGGGTNYMFRTSGAAGAGAGVFFINGSDIGTVLLKACDLDQDGKVTLAEFKA